MPKTPNLNISHIEESQQDKEVTANEAFDALDDAMNSQLDVSNADSNFSLTVAQLTRHRSFHLTGATTASRTMTVPAHEREFTVWNETGNDVVVSTGVSPGGKTVTLADDEEATLACDGVDVRRVARLVEALPGHIDPPEAKTYTLIQSIPFPARVISITHQTGAGDIDFTLKKNGSNITGLTSLSAGVTEATATASGANDLAVGDKLTLTVGSLGSPTPEDYQFTVKLVRL